MCQTIYEEMSCNIKEKTCNNAAQIRNIAEQLFPIDNIISLKKSRYGLEAKTYELKTTREELVLKCYPVSRISDVQNETHIIEYLNANGIPPFLVKSRDGNRYAISRYGILVLLKRIKGVHQKRIKNQKQAKAFGMELGRIHNILSGLSSDKSIPDVKCIDYILGVKNQLKQCDLWKGSAFVREFIKTVESVNWSSFSQKWYTKGVIHSDITVDNLIFTNDAIYVIDYGDAGVGWLLMDLSISIISLAIIDKKFVDEIFRQILLGYRATSMLNDYEFKDLGEFIKLGCLRKCSAYFDYLKNRNMVIKKYDIYLNAINLLPSIDKKIRGCL